VRLSDGAQRKFTQTLPWPPLPPVPKKQTTPGSRGAIQQRNDAKRYRQQAIQKYYRESPIVPNTGQGYVKARVRQSPRRSV